MTTEKKRETVERFKQFLKKHPEITAHVRSHGLKWNDLFDNWVLFGDSPDIWASYGMKIDKKADASAQQHPDAASEQAGSSLTWSKLVEKIDQFDATEWQERLETISGALGGLQTFIGQFKQKEKKAQQRHAPQQQPGVPFRPQQPTAARGGYPSANRTRRPFF
ncbi:MAG: spore coat protein YlbD [Sporolactobacillus sp.]